MSYRDFTDEEVIHRFGLQVDHRAEVYASIPGRPIGDILRATLRFYVPRAVAMDTEKARSEFMVGPVLMEVVRQLNDSVCLFSGRKFFVDQEEGLAGFPDFLFSRSPNPLQITAPIMVLVESKSEDIQEGYPQCLAQMVAAQRFNENKGRSVQTIYGCVTSGSVWQFLSLTSVNVTIDLTEYYINEVDRIVGILVHMLTAEELPKP